MVRRNAQERGGGVRPTPTKHVRCGGGKFAADPLPLSLDFDIALRMVQGSKTLPYHGQ